MHLSWAQATDADSLSISHHLHVVHPLTIPPRVLFSKSMGQEEEAIVPTLGNFSALVRFTLTATDGAGNTASLDIDCHLRTQAPPVGSVWIDGGAVRLAPGSYALASQQPVSVCWAGFGSGENPVATYAYSVISMADDSSSISEKTAGPNTTCASVTALVAAPGPYLVRLSAIGEAGHVGSHIEVALVIDDTAPRASDELIVHTDGPLDNMQASECCLRVSWASWIEIESGPVRYTFCVTGAGGCDDIGDATGVLVASSDSCKCHPPSSSTAHVKWARVSRPLPLFSTESNNSEVRFSLVGSNQVGMRGEAVNSAVVIERRSTLLEPEVTFELPTFVAVSALVATASDMEDTVEGAIATSVSVCGWAGVDGSLLHRTARLLTVAWNPTDEIYRHELCLRPDSQADASSLDCQRAAGSDASVSMQPPASGLFNLSYTSISRGGIRQELRWGLTFDDTPPIQGRVSAGGPAGYWVLPGLMTCTWEEAIDVESGIGMYEVGLIEVSTADSKCTASGPIETALGGKMLVSQNVSCDARNASLMSALRHSGRYRCVVWAINGAGMRSSPRSSRDVVVDLSGGKLLPSRALSIRDALGEPAISMRNLSLTIQFEVELYGEADLVAQVRPRADDCATSRSSNTSSATDTNASSIRCSAMESIAAVEYFAFSLFRQTGSDALSIAATSASSSNAEDADAGGVANRIVKIGSTHLVRLGHLTSPCCATTYVSKGEALHDGWLVLPDASQHEIPRRLGLINASWLLIASHDSIRFTSMGADSDDLRFRLPPITMSSLVQPGAACGGADDSATVDGIHSGEDWWAVETCGSLHIFSSKDASSSRELPLDASACARGGVQATFGKEHGHILCTDVNAAFSSLSRVNLLGSTIGAKTTLETRTSQRGFCIDCKLPLDLPGIPTLLEPRLAGTPTMFPARIPPDLPPGTQLSVPPSSRRPEPHAGS